MKTGNESNVNGQVTQNDDLQDKDDEQAMEQRPESSTTPRLQSSKSDMHKHNTQTTGFPQIKSVAGQNLGNLSDNEVSAVRSVPRPASHKQKGYETEASQVKLKLQVESQAPATNTLEANATNNEYGLLVLNREGSQHVSMNEEQRHAISCSNRSIGREQINVDDDEDEDGHVEHPALDEIEEGISTPKKRPLKRNSFKSRKMMGNTSYRSRDRIWPSGSCFVIFTVLLIFVPSIPVLTAVPIELAGPIAGPFIILVYACSLFQSLRFVYLCATTDPGILPKIRAKSVSYQKQYRVTYMEADERQRTYSEEKPVEAYFSTALFKMASPEGQNDATTLSYCNTCQIVRPPRSYHCGSCGFCVEVHDHHCPWMGTCIGLRNIRYFVCFLFYTSMHSLVTAVISFCFFWFETRDSPANIFAKPSQKGDEVPTQAEKLIHASNMVSLIYSLCFFIMLGIFALSVHCQIMDNVTTNEKIRKKWNAKNRDSRRADNGVKPCDKFRYIYFGKLPVSRIQRYHELRQQAIDKARERAKMGSASMVSQSSFAASVGGGSVGGAGNGFDFEDIELEGNLQKYVRAVQKGLLKEIDNEAVLKAYGINITPQTETAPQLRAPAALGSVPSTPHQSIAQGGANIPLNGSGSLDFNRGIGSQRNSDDANCRVGSAGTTTGAPANGSNLNAFQQRSSQVANEP